MNSNRSSISTARRLEYARGFLALGLVEEAKEELDEIPEVEQGSLEMMEVMMDYHSQRENWKSAASLAESVTAQKPDEPHGWISWAYAVRRSRSIAAAERILLRAEKRIGQTCALVHYNLACYRCQQGDHLGALSRLAIAFRMESHWKQAALADPDLAPLKDKIEAVIR